MSKEVLRQMTTQQAILKLQVTSKGCRIERICEGMSVR
jgi:hypothetical protein